MLTKSEIRKIYKQKRADMNKADVAEKSRMAAEAFIASKLYRNASQLMLYMPLGNETDTAAIIAAALADGKKLVLPLTDRKTYEITPVLWDGESELREGAFSVKEPADARLADISRLDLVIVPGISFDMSGARVGFGKGCYDRFLEGISAVKLGFCYDFQLADKIPADEHDVKMDFLVTESGLVRTKK